MNLLFVSDYKVSPNAGGIERVIYSLTEMFENKGVRCYSLYFDTFNVENSVSFKDEIQINRHSDCSEVLRSYLVVNKIDIVIVTILSKRNFPFMPVLYRITRSLNCKVIYTYHTMPGYELQLRVSIKLASFYLRRKLQPVSKIALMLSINFVNKLGLQRILKPIIKRKLSYGLYSDVVCLLSESYIDVYKNFVGNTDVPFVAISNPLTYVEEVMPDLQNNKEKIVLNVGRFDILAKRQDLLLKIWSKVEKSPISNYWKLVIVGYGAEGDFLKSYAKQLNLKRVQFVGFCDPFEYYEKASIYAMTSSYEGFPMVLLEAQQYGDVPLAFDSFAAVKDLIENKKNGYIIPQGDVDEYSSKLLGLIENDAVRKSMAVGCTNTIAKYGKDAILQKWLNLFDDLRNGKF